MRRFVTFWLLCGLLGPWLALALAQTPGPEGFQALVARDARVGFSPRTGLIAGEALANEKSSKELRAAAWYALGAIGAAERRPELLETAQKGSEPERGAAVLALGEIGATTAAPLLEFARSEDAELAATALLALLRSRSPALQRAVEEIARDAANKHSALAAKLLVFAADPARAEPTPAAERLLELRWRAAREFGLVDGQTWKVLLFQALAERDAFRNDVILRAGARLDRPGVRDLLLGALLHGSGEGRLRAAARGIPRELAQLVPTGLWKPADLSEWRTLFDALEEEHLEAYAPELFDAALAEPALKARALHLLSRSGEQDLAPEIEAALPGADVEARVWLCRAMGESEDPTYLQRLKLLSASGDVRVRAAALVAQIRLSSRPGEAALRGALEGEDAALRAALLSELAANSRAPAAQLLLESAFGEEKEGERRVLALALAREGSREARAWCREALLADPPPSAAEARELVAALRSGLSSEDTAVLRAVFPREDTPENLALNVDMGLALCELGDSWVSPLLGSALWRGNFEVSLLAGALLAQTSGMHALRDEAANPPASARSTDLRRVGFALGTWGGLPEVEALAQALRYNSGAPALQGVLLGFLSLRTQ